MVFNPLRAYLPTFKPVRLVSSHETSKLKPRHVAHQRLHVAMVLLGDGETTRELFSPPHGECEMPMAKNETGMLRRAGRVMLVWKPGKPTSGAGRAGLCVAISGSGSGGGRTYLD